MKKIYVFILVAAVFSGQTAFGQNPTASQNYVLETTVKAKGKKTAASLTGLPIDSANRTVQYMDAFGRVIQTVSMQGSPLYKDLVQPLVYDDFGRQAVQYLPYAEQSSADGSFKNTVLANQSSFYNSATGWDAGTVKTANPYSATVFEPSPLNRVLEQGSPGSVWQPAASRTATAGRTIVVNYSLNTRDDDVRRWRITSAGASGSEFYGGNKLYKNISKDENWVSGKTGTVEEFKDFKGRIVAKRAWQTEYSALSTYYVYDEAGNLRYVIPPAVTAASFLESAAVFTDFIYGYRYDGRGRMIEKKIPGKSGWEQFIYNRLDQLVLSRDPVQGQTTGSPYPYFSFTKYDKLGRVIMAGVERDYNEDRAAVQSHFDNNTAIKLWEDRSYSGWFGYTLDALPTGTATMDVQVVNYYDNYNIEWIPENQGASYSNKTQGLLTASRVKVLGTSGDYLWTVNYYDDEGRIVRIYQQHYLSGTTAANNYDEIINTYNFVGELTKSTRSHYVSGVEKLYTYNEYTYDHQGRAKLLKQKTGENAGTSNPLVVISGNTYNEVGQLKDKGLHSVNNGATYAQNIAYSYNERGWLSSQVAPLFNQYLKYQEPVTGVTPQYNGNISRQQWGTGKFYNYGYDVLNRLTSASSDDNNNEGLTYDRMGNILTLTRRSSNNIVDQLSYTYTGNKLTAVSDENANTNANFQLPGITAYTYDNNGNMISRVNTSNTVNNMTGMTYNNFNLPQAINVNGAAISYTYDGIGNKLKKNVTGTASLNNEYIGGIQYENGALKTINTAAGRIVKYSATNYQFEYTLSDHLGNGRVYFDIDGNGAARKIQETDYYAFGLSIARSLNGTENKYQYNGKEKQDQEKMYDYGARFYDPIIGRWNVVDPLSEDYMHWSPYNYVMNSPSIYIDPDGREREALTTRYVDSNGKTIVNTNDGRKDVVKVPWSRLGEFLENAYWARNGHSDSQSWNDYWRGQFGIYIKESTLNDAGHYLLETEAARAAQAKYLVTGKGGDFKDFVYKRLFASWSDPVSVVTYIMAGAHGMASILELKPSFGNTSEQIWHATRHIEAKGLNVQAIKAAIIKDLKPASSYRTGVRITGTVIVNSVEVTYSGVKLPNGKINIGSIKPPR